MVRIIADFGWCWNTGVADLVTRTIVLALAYMVAYLAYVVHDLLQLLYFIDSLFLSKSLVFSIFMQEYHLLPVKSNFFGGIQIQCPGECGIDCWRSLLGLNLSPPSFNFLLQVSDSFSRGTLH